MGHRLVPGVALGREGPARQVVDGGVVHGDEAHAGPGSMAMLQRVMRPSIDRPRMALPPNSMA